MYRLKEGYIINNIKYLAIIIVIILTSINIVIATQNIISNPNSLQIIGFSEKIPAKNINFTYINESEFYKDKKRTFEVGLPA